MKNIDLRSDTVKPDDYHFARTRLLCLENTQSGKVLPLDYMARARRLADAHGLALHLDGARVFNAAVTLGVSAHTITAPFDIPSANPMRLVTHMDVSDDDVDRVVETARSFFASHMRRAG